MGGRRPRRGRVAFGPSAYYLDAPVYDCCPCPDDPYGALGDVPGVFAKSVEDWRDLVTSKAGDLPINFLMAWISRESNGNPCSYTKFAEAGIFQLMNGDNMNFGNTTLAAQHPAPPCTAGIQTTAYFASLTPDQQNAQVQAGIDYINNYARPQAHRYLDAAGYSWDESSGSFWILVKQVFDSPAMIPGVLAAATAELGSPPPDWATLKTTTAGSQIDPSGNAQFVGSYGDGGGSVLSSLFPSATSPASLLVIAGGLALFSYLYWSR